MNNNHGSYFFDKTKYLQSVGKYKARYLERAEEEAVEWIKESIADANSPAVESPIEQLLFDAWMLHLMLLRRFGSPYGGDAIYSVISESPDALEMPNRSLDQSVGQEDILVVQPKIKQYRADFAFQRSFKFHGPTATLRSQVIVVECDGHEFHEKTKDQAARDKKRDRDLVSTGCAVIRFTGSEIWKDAFGCVEQIEGIVEESCGRSFEASRGRS